MKTELFVSLNFYLRTILTLTIYPVYLFYEHPLRQIVLWGIIVFFIISKTYSLYYFRIKFRNKWVKYLRLDVKLVYAMSFFPWLYIAGQSLVSSNYLSWLFFLGFAFYFDILSDYQKSEIVLVVDKNFWSYKTNLIMLNFRVLGVLTLFLMSFLPHLVTQVRIGLILLISVSYLVSVLLKKKPSQLSIWEIFYFASWFIIYLMIILEYVDSHSELFYVIQGVFYIIMIEIFCLNPKFALSPFKISRSN